MRSNRRKSTVVLIVAGLAMNLVRCGDGEAKNRRSPDAVPGPGVPSEPEPPPAPGAANGTDPEDVAASGTEDVAPPPATRKFTEAELMTLVGLSAAESQSAYGHCRDVLAQGIYDRYQESVSDTVKHALKERFCAMAEDEFAEKVETYFNEQRSGSHGGSHADSFGFSYMEYIGLEVATSGTSSSSSSQAVTRAQALDTARKWKTSHCGASSMSQTSDFEHTVLSERIDEGVLAAWRGCVTKASNGFFCESSETEDTVSVHLKWDPNAVQATLLPKLNLKQQTAHNLELTSAEVPSTLGTGSGVSITYKRLDASKPSVFEAQGSDSVGQVDFNCSIQVSKVVRGRIKEDPACGLKELNLGTGPACGVERYAARRDPLCGVESYVEAASSACGVRAYNVGPHPACPGFVSHDVRTFSTSAQSCTSDAEAPDSCPEGYLDRGVAERTKTCRGRVSDTDWTQVIGRTRTCERPEFLASCEHPDLGVREWKVCAHPSHGVLRYRSCENASFGVASYKSCRHESFGKSYNRCFVPD